MPDSTIIIFSYSISISSYLGYLKFWRRAIENLDLQDDSYHCSEICVRCEFVKYKSWNTVYWSLQICSVLFDLMLMFALNIYIMKTTPGNTSLWRLSLFCCSLLFIVPNKCSADPSIKVTIASLVWDVIHWKFTYKLCLYVIISVCWKSPLLPLYLK